MDEDKVVITYETIFELLRREKDREALQKLEKTFFQDILDYLKERKDILINQKSSLTNPEERKKNEKQFQNIKKLVSDFYDRREKKIISMALDKSRTKEDLADTSTLLEEEKNLFEKLVRLLNENRSNVLYRVLDLETTKKEEEKEETETEKKVKDIEEEDKKEKSALMVRFIHAVPKFIGKELEEYGPFEEEEITNLPEEIANVLIKKGRAEEIRES